MQKNIPLLKKIEKINSSIERLKHKKLNIIEKQTEKHYCPHCNRLYPSSKIKSWLEFSKGAFLEAIWVKCPKGHEWDEK